MCKAPSHAQHASSQAGLAGIKLSCWLVMWTARGWAFTIARLVAGVYSPPAIRQGHQRPVRVRLVVSGMTATGARNGPIGRGNGWIFLD